MSTPAARKKQRAYRRRLACGKAVLKIEAPLYPLIQAMIVSGRLNEVEALDRCEVERQVGAIVEEWRQRWAAVG